MTRSPSFRRRLAVRIALTVSLLLLLASLLGYVALRAFLYRRLDATVLRLAQIEAAATADSPDESVHFHDDVFLASGPGHEAVLNRFAQVWTLEGAPVVRTRNLGATDLPLPAPVRERVVATDQSALFSFELEGRRFRAVLYPLGLLGPTHALHLLQVAASTDETDALLRQVLAFLAALVVLGFAAGGGVSWWLSGYAVRPVLEIIHEAEVFRVASPGHHISAHADTEEHRRLVAVLNEMLGRVDDALEGQRRFLADAGHAIKTPLTILRGDLDVTLRRERPPDEYRETLAQTLADLKDVSALADDLITLARSDGDALQAAAEPVALDDLLRRVARRFEGAAHRAGIALTVAEGPPVVVPADPGLVARAVGNLVDNAIKYGRPGGSVRLSLQPRGATVAVEVADDGPGVSPEELGRVQERFYRGERGRAAVPGTGLGLAIVGAVARAHGGGFELRSNPAGGISAELRLPLAPPRSLAAPAPPGAEADAPPPPGRGRAAGRRL